MIEELTDADIMEMIYGYVEYTVHIPYHTVEVPLEMVLCDTIKDACDECGFEIAWGSGCLCNVCTFLDNIGFLDQERL